MNKFFTAQRLKDTAYVTVGAFIFCHFNQCGIIAK